MVVVSKMDTTTLICLGAYGLQSKGGGSGGMFVNP